jgi:DUF971 family protein
MTRSVYLDAPRATVIGMCATQNVPIAMIEILGSGGTRVVLHNSHDAGLIASAYSHLVLPVKPTPV